MCGLVGVAGTLNKKAVDAFNDLLAIDAIRGPHSTGVASVDRSRDYQLIKQPWLPQELMEHKKYQQVVTEHKCALIGHNRFATRGNICGANAHPFGFNKLVGAHNGTIDQHSLRKLDNPKDWFETDSETVFWNFNQKGFEKVVPDLEGAWCFVWYDKTDNKLRFLRNEKRPFYYVYNKDQTQIFWASEVDMLHFVFRRHGIEWHSKPHELPVDKVQARAIPTYNTAFHAPEESDLAGYKWSSDVVHWSEYTGQGFQGRQRAEVRKEPPPFEVIKNRQNLPGSSGSTSRTEMMSSTSASTSSGQSEKAGQSETYSVSGSAQTTGGVAAPKRGLIVFDAKENQWTEDGKPIPDPTDRQKKVAEAIMSLRSSSKDPGIPDEDKEIALPPQYLPSNQKVLELKRRKFRPPYRDGRGLTMGKQKFLGFMKNHTCVWCDNSGEAIEWGEEVIFARSTHNDGVPEWICPDCCQKEEVRNFMKG